MQNGAAKDRVILRKVAPAAANQTHLHVQQRDSQALLHHRDSAFIEESFTHTMRNWVNHHLKSRDMHLADLEHGLADGVALGTLLEVLTGQQIDFHHHPKSEFEILEGLENMLKFIQAHGIK